MDPKDLIKDLMEGEEISVDDEDDAEEYSEFQPKDMTEIQGIVEDAIDDAVSFIEDELGATRIKAQRYYDGLTDLSHEDGRSKVVATKVRDTIRAIKPSLMRVFLSTGRYGEFIPRGPEDVNLAEQQTEAAHQKLEAMNGFRLLSDAFHDALLKKTGIIKVYYEEYQDAQVYTFTGLNDLQYEAISADPDIEIIEEEVGEDLSRDVKIIRRETRGDICAVSVPPEEFFIDRNARSLDDFYICGHRSDKRVADLVAMGFDFDEVKDLDAYSSDSATGDMEDAARRGYMTDTNDDDPSDPSMKNVMVTEAYMRIDPNGNGAALLHKFILGGTKYKVLSMEPCDGVPFAVFEVDPEPHAFFGHSLADILMDDQDASTSMLRGILDNVAMVNNPRLSVVEGQANIEDVLNNEIGAVVRMKQQGAVTPLVVPFTAASTLTAVQYMDQMTEEKTGVLKASGGLSPDALQSTTAAAVSATVQAAAGQVEVMARNLAEGGVKQLLKLILSLLTKHPDAMDYMRLNGEYMPVDPRVWDASMDLSVNVGLGTGQQEQKAMMLREILGLQMQVYQGYGAENGVVSLTNIRNTVSDMLASSGIRNAERYFAPITPEYEQQLNQMRAQQEQAMSQGGSDPNQAFLQAEQMKAMARAQTDAAKVQLDGQKAMMQDDRERDKMAQDFALKQAELMGKLGVQANAAALKAEQERNRYGGM